MTWSTVWIFSCLFLFENLKRQCIVYISAVIQENKCCISLNAFDNTTVSTQWVSCSSNSPQTYVSSFLTTASVWVRQQHCMFKTLPHERDMPRKAQEFSRNFFSCLLQIPACFHWIFCFIFSVCYFPFYCLSFFQLVDPGDVWAGIWSCIYIHLPWNCMRSIKRYLAFALPDPLSRQCENVI